MKNHLDAYIMLIWIKDFSFLNNVPGSDCCTLGISIWQVHLRVQTDYLKLGQQRILLIPATQLSIDDYTTHNPTEPHCTLTK